MGAGRQPSRADFEREISLRALERVGSVSNEPNPVPCAKATREPLIRPGKWNPPWDTWQGFIKWHSARRVGPRSTMEAGKYLYLEYISHSAHETSFACPCESDGWVSQAIVTGGVC